MNFKKIVGLQDVYPERIEGTSEWYYCSVSKNSFCDLYEAEEIVGDGHVYEGMTCVLIHFPDGTVYKPFELKENIFVDEPVYWGGKLYFLSVDFHTRKMQIISFDEKSHEKNVVVELSLDEVEDCYNLMLHVAPVFLTREANDGYLEVVWPEKKRIKLEKRESLMFRDEDKIYCSEWFEDPDYHEKVVVRDWHTGEITEIFDGQMMRMPNGEIWVL